MAAVSISDMLKQQVEDNSYVADVDSLAALASGRSVVSKRIWRCSGSPSVIASSRRSTISTTTKASASTEPATKSSSASKSAASAETPTGSKTTSKATTSTCKTTWGRSGEAILSNFKHAALPFVAVELGNRITGIFWTFESDNTGTFGTTIMTDMDIGTNDGTLLSCEHYPSTLSSDLLGVSCFVLVLRERTYQLVETSLSDLASQQYRAAKVICVSCARNVIIKPGR